LSLIYTCLTRFAAGDVFPGDGLLLSSNALQVSQSALTGEVLAVDKFHRKPDDEESLIKKKEAFELLHDPHVVLQGTSVTTGGGTALMCLTGNCG
jgi:P-type Mg2+ transporter